MIPPPEVTGNGELRRDQLLHPSVLLLRPLLLLLLLLLIDRRRREAEGDDDELEGMKAPELVVWFGRSCRNRREGKCRTGKERKKKRKRKRKKRATVLKKLIFFFNNTKKNFSTTQINLHTST